MCKTSFCEIWHSFSGLPLETFYGVITDNLKKVKKNAILFKLFWYKVFVHWKLQFLNSLLDSMLI